MKRKILMGLAFLLTLGALAAAQVPGVNSPFQMVYTYAYDNSTAKPTYSATTVAYSLAASARGVFQINGSSSKLIRVRRIIISGSVPATALAEPIYINKVSTSMPSTGTSVLLTAVPYDSASSAATATVENFTANPTDPTLVGEVMSPVYRFLPNSTGVQPYTVELGALGSAGILRTASEGLSLNLAGVTTSAVVTVGVEWTEE